MKKLSENIIFFSEGNKNYIKSIGGKGANLCELVKGNFPIPDGFCLTTKVYLKISDKANITNLIDELSEIKDISKNKDTIKTLAKAIQSKIKAVGLLDDILKELNDSYHQLGCKNVAIRSSSTAEDLKEASFAGQQDTFLNIIGQDMLLTAVKDCFSSLWNERAIIYRISNNVDHKVVSISVIIQKLINSTKSGVLFTANPITGCRNESVIEAGFGLGEAIVSGITTPDQYTINMNNDFITKNHIEKERTIISAAKNGGTKSKITNNYSDTPVLLDEEIIMIAKLGKKIEIYYSSPQDIEWSIDDKGTLWILQSRPITTLFPIPKDIYESNHDIKVYFSATGDEGVTRPITPMGIQVFKMMVNSVGEYLWGIKVKTIFDDSKIAVELGERFYYDITPLIKNRFGRKIVDTVLNSFDNYTLQIWNEIKKDKRFELKKTSFIRILWIILSPIFRTKFISLIIKAIVNPDKARINNIKAFNESIKFSIPSSTPYQERVEMIGKFIFKSLKNLFNTGFSEAIAGYICFSISKTFLGKLATENDFQKVLRGLPNNPTTEMNLEMWNMSMEIKKDNDLVNLLNSTTAEEIRKIYDLKKLPVVFQNLMDKFIQKYGVRTVSEVDIGISRWNEDSTYIFKILQNYIKLKDLNKSPDLLFQNSKTEGEDIVLDLKRKAKNKNFIRGILVSWGLDRARCMIGRRELWKVQLSSIFSVAREELIKIGNSLVAETILNNSEDIFFLNFNEIIKAINKKDVKDLVLKNKKLYKDELKRTKIPMMILSDGTIPVSKTTVYTTGLQSNLSGIAASPGKITGRVRIVLDPEIAIVEPGDIIVAPSTDPCWTPLFLIASGLVMEKGGAISHGAVVAREYGIPAVVGVIGVLDKLIDGQNITVDGDNGIVIIE